MEVTEESIPTEVRVKMTVNGEKDPEKQNPYIVLEPYESSLTFRRVPYVVR